MKKHLLLLAFTLYTAVAFAQYAPLTNLPTLYVNTFGNKAITSKTVYIYATLTYVSADRYVVYDSVEIRGRGNSTWGLAKKPYRIKFKESTKFLGKGYAKARSWTLMANHADKSLIRNAVTSDLGDRLGLPFNPAAHFVDLVLNGTYLGNYQISDQVNVDNKRVDIVEQEQKATATSNITGGYLVEIDGFGNSEPVNFRTSKNLIISVKSPDENIIIPAQTTYIRTYLNTFEAALFSTDFKDAVKGYRPYADSATLVPWYIATELSANVDGFWSTYIYKNQDDPKIYFGPLWDYDIAYNNCSRVGDVTQKTMIDAGYGSDLTKVWVKQMINDPWFNKAVNDCWKQKLAEGLEKHMLAYVDSLALYLDRSQAKNYSKYSISSKVYNEIYLYSTYAEYINQLKTFISQHIVYLTTVFAQRAGDTGESGGGEDEDPELKPFALQDEYYYRIDNRGVNKALDVLNQGTTAGSKVVIWEPQFGRATQQWQIVKVGAYYQLLNRASGLAFNDPSPTSATGTQLNLVDPDATDKRQLWQLATVNENGIYNLINVSTGHAINNTGGSTTDGNAVVSYTSDARNSTSNNRQWLVYADERIPDYISEEVREQFASVIQQAQKFLDGLSEKMIGTDALRYSEERIAALRQSVDDALVFESTVEDDYIMATVNLNTLLQKALQYNLPNGRQLFTIRHLQSGLYLDVSNQVRIHTKDEPSTFQRFMFRPAEEEGKYYLLSEGGLYVMLAGTNQWSMAASTAVTVPGNATYQVGVEGEVHTLMGINGLLGTDSNTNGSAVFGNKSEQGGDAFSRARWEICYTGNEYLTPLEQKEVLLQKLLIQADSLLAVIQASSVGTAPFQYATDAVDDLQEAVTQARLFKYETVEDYADFMDWLQDGIGYAQRLNAPDPAQDYLLVHQSGYVLSASEGLLLEQADPSSRAQRVRLVPVEGVSNAYAIYINGYYISLWDEKSGTLALTDTPRDAYGRFAATAVADSAFRLQTLSGGYLGPEGEAKAGVSCGGNALPEAGVWTLKPMAKLPEGGDDGLDYLSKVSYALKYEAESQTLRFVSDDLQALSTVTVRLFTTGVRLLYTFSASEPQNVALLPNGTYLVTWTVNGDTHTVKFKK